MIRHWKKCYSVDICPQWKVSAKLQIEVGMSSKDNPSRHNYSYISLIFIFKGPIDQVIYCLYIRLACPLIVFSVIGLAPASQVPERNGVLKQCIYYSLKWEALEIILAAYILYLATFLKIQDPGKIYIMGKLTVEHSEDQKFESKSLETLETIICEDKNSEKADKCTPQLDSKCMPSVFPEDVGKVNDLLEKGCSLFGCSHYRRRCRIRAPCCNEIYDCRHCHNEAKDSIDVDQKDRHDMPCHEVSQVICSLCGTEQQVQQFCINCGVCMGKYFCATCKLFDDDTSKKQYHCSGCGICRTGGSENFFHCYKCGCCYSILLKNSHPCIEGAMHHDCPVCFEYLFDSRNDVTVMPCGHTIHQNCLKEMRDHFQYACPLCSKSAYDMSKLWEKYDLEIAGTPMPEAYQNKMVWILCNDCGKTAQVQFHVVGQKCLNCKSYNTRQTRG